MLEYRYTRFRQANPVVHSDVGRGCPLGPSGVCTSTTAINASSDIQSVRIGVNYYFR